MKPASERNYEHLETYKGFEIEVFTHLDPNESYFDIRVGKYDGDLFVDAKPRINQRVTGPAYPLNRLLEMVASTKAKVDEAEADAARQRS